MIGTRLKTYLESLAAAGVDGASAYVAVGGQRRAEAWVGADVTAASRFDLASLTKAFLGTLALRLDQSGTLSLGRKVGSLAPAAPVSLRDKTLEDLLRHQSGLLAWVPFYAHLQQPPQPSALEWLLRRDCMGAFAPTYSDLGYLVWGWLAEATLAKPLSELLRIEVLEPLGLTDRVVAYPGPGGNTKTVPCRLDNAVEVRLARALGPPFFAEIEEEGLVRRGIPQDGNARFLAMPGQFVGHCGLFGDAAAMAALAESWRQGTLLTSETKRRALTGAGRYAIGWWPHDREGAAGPALSPRAYGMVGFTGGSCWIDPERELVAVLLCHRRTTTLDLRPWRQRFHALAVELSEARP